MAVILLTKDEQTIMHATNVRPGELINKVDHKNIFLGTDEEQENLKLLVDCYIPNKRIER